jgi:hypothetical protein
MNLNDIMHSVATGARRHPWRTATAVCVPVVAVGVLSGATIASAGPEPMLAVPASAASAAPAPYVANFASDPSGKKIVLKAGAVTVKEPWNIDGCDHDYGTPNQCVPWKIPGSPGQACSWLASMGFGPLKVYGTNRQHLPENAEGYVCASGA